jgi:hypothetical protein
MTRYRVIYHAHTGTEFPEIDVDSPDEAAEVTREMWVRGEGEVIYDDVNSVEIIEIKDATTTYDFLPRDDEMEPVEPSTETVS